MAVANQFVPVPLTRFIRTGPVAADQVLPLSVLISVKMSKKLEIWNFPPPRRRPVRPASDRCRRYKCIGISDILREKGVVLFIMDFEV